MNSISQHKQGGSSPKQGDFLGRRKAWGRLKHQDGAESIQENLVSFSTLLPVLLLDEQGNLWRRSQGLGSYGVLIRILTQPDQKERLQSCLVVQATTTR